MHWCLRLKDYSFTFMYRKGACNQQADALSRLETHVETIHEDWYVIPCFHLDDKEATTPLKQDFKCARSGFTGSDTEWEGDESDLANAPADELFAAQPAPQSSDPCFTPIYIEELLTAQ